MADEIDPVTITMETRPDRPHPRGLRCSVAVVPRSVPRTPRHDRPTRDPARVLGRPLTEGPWPLRQSSKCSGMSPEPRALSEGRSRLSVAAFEVRHVMDYIYGPRPVITRPGEGERIGRRGHRVLVELPQIEVLGLSFGPDFEGVDPHTHADHTDSFYVLEGEFEFLQDGDWRRVGPGTFLSVPRTSNTPSAPAAWPSASSTFTRRTPASSRDCGKARCRSHREMRRSSARVFR